MRATIRGRTGQGCVVASCGRFKEELGTGMRGSTGGWSIWARTGERIRQFTVAMASESQAVAALRSENPDIEVLARHSVDTTIIAQLGMADGEILEWLPLDCKEQLATASTPMSE